MQLLQQAESFTRIVGSRRKAQVHRDDGRFEAAHLRNGAVAIAGDDRFVTIERPLHLLLQGRVVLDDQQRLARVSHATRSSAGAAFGPAAESARGRRTSTDVPTFSSLCTWIPPPMLATY